MLGNSVSSKNGGGERIDVEGEFLILLTKGGRRLTNWITSKGLIYIC